MNTNWREQFDKQFPTVSKNIETLQRQGTMHERFVTTGREKLDMQPIKDFIERTLTTQKEEIRKVVEGMKITDPSFEELMLQLGGSEVLSHRDTQNNLIDRILAELNK